MSNRNINFNLRSQAKDSVNQKTFFVVQFENGESGYFMETRCKKFEDDDSCMVNFGKDGKFCGTILLTGNF